MFCIRTTLYRGTFQLDQDQTNLLEPLPFRSFGSFKTCQNRQVRLPRSELHHNADHCTRSVLRRRYGEHFRYHGGKCQRWQNGFLVYPQIHSGEKHQLC